MSKKTKNITVMAMLVAVSVVLVYLIHFPLFPTAPFLEYDPADIPILLAAILYGPWGGLTVALIASAIQAVTVSAQSGVYGFLMHFIAAAALALPVGFLARSKQKIMKEYFSLAIGVLSMSLVMLVANHFITPFFMGVDPSTVDAMLLTVFLPFNLLKSIINSAAAFFIYHALSLAHIVQK